MADGNEPGAMGEVLFAQAEHRFDQSAVCNGDMGAPELRVLVDADGLVADQIDELSALRTRLELGDDILAVDLAKFVDADTAAEVDVLQFEAEMAVLDGLVDSVRVNGVSEE